jgi:hypothetical protein
MNVAQETLGLRRGSLSLPLSLLMSAFALLIPPAVLTNHLHRLTERSPTARAFPLIHSLSVHRVPQLDFGKRFGVGRAFALNLANIARSASPKRTGVN